MREVVIGVISDTHGLLRPEAVETLRGVAHIVHAGDVGHPPVLEALREMAPTTVVRGNCDHGKWAEALPLRDTVSIANHRLYVVHDANDLGTMPAPDGCDVVVTGHTHRPVSEVRQGILYLNPGSAGPKRFNLPISLALLRLDGTRITPEHIDLVTEMS